jgi:integrase/recombinase XerD
MKKSKNIELPKVIQEMIKSNDGHRVKIRYRKLKDFYSIYLDLCNGFERKTVTIDKKILNTVDSKADDVATRDFVFGLRSELESKFIQDKHGFLLKDNTHEIDFIKYTEDIIKKRTHGNYKAMLKHLINFSNGKLIFKNVTPSFCEEFKEYLLNVKTLKGNKNLSIVTVKYYLRSLSVILNRAVKDGIINNNPNRENRVRYYEPEKTFLTLDEVKLFFEVDTNFIYSQNAFVFSCFTGLRISEIRILNFKKHISEEHIYFPQQKTGKRLRIKIKTFLFDIIEKQKKRHPGSDKIFLLPNQSTVQRQLQKIGDKAKLSKHLTFHVSRHTFATLLLTYGSGIKTVSELLGHSDLRTTLVYAKLVDSVKDKAIDDLPEF